MHAAGGAWGLARSCALHALARLPAARPPARAASAARARRLPAPACGAPRRLPPRIGGIAAGRSQGPGMPWRLPAEGGGGGASGRRRRGSGDRLILWLSPAGPSGRSMGSQEAHKPLGGRPAGCWGPQELGAASERLRIGWPLPLPVSRACKSLLLQAAACRKPCKPCERTCASPDSSGPAALAPLLSGMSALQLWVGPSIKLSLRAAARCSGPHSFRARSVGLCSVLADRRGSKQVL